MAIKINYIDTPIGVLKTGDYVKIENFCPSISESTIPGFYKVYAIWSRNGTISLALEVEGEINSIKGFSMNGNILRNIVQKISLENITLKQMLGIRATPVHINGQ